jgi:hypothetical protein
MKGISIRQPELLEEWYQELERIASSSEELAVSKP